MAKLSLIQTTDYSQFHLHKKNRIINYKKVQKLANAMKEKNLLHLFPIIVDKDMTILDGQHRFEAAKLAKVQLYYVISAGEYEIENVAETNNFQSGWRLGDFINYFAKENKEPYLKLIELSKKYHCTPSRIANLSDLTSIVGQIKEGTLEFTDFMEIKSTLHLAKTIGIEFAFEHWNSRSFLRAMKHTLNMKGFNSLRLQQKIQMNRKLLVKCHEAEQYIKLLEEIYNTKSNEPLRFL